jgi:hypothetical protein
MVELTRAQLDAIADAPDSCQNTLSRAFSGCASPRGAIKAFCLQCVGFDRSEIKNCTARACALHAYRPFVALGQIVQSAVPEIEAMNK